MSQPVSSNNPNDPESEGGQQTHGDDSAMDQFHARNRAHKRRLFRRIAEGAAFGTSKQVAEDQDLGDKVMKFVEWLGEHIP